jgi:uncharacterized phage protein (TIGR01671 family)
MMSREIKFRAWDKEAKLMRHHEKDGRGYYHEDAESWGLTIAMLVLGNMTGVRDEFMERYDLMQYTGLKDKNGKEIYEGDVLSDGKEAHLYIVVWVENLASFGINKKGWAFTHFFMEAIEPDDLEVIGNIYENPELLEAGK